MREKKIEAIENISHGYDLMIEKDTGNLFRVLTGSPKRSLETWKRLKQCCENTISTLEESMPQEEEKVEAKEEEEDLSAPDEVPLSGQEIVEQYFDNAGVCCFEGESGLKALNEFCSELGYREEPFRFGSPIERFLCDNSGAINAIIEWVGEWTDKSDEWRKCLLGTESEEDGDGDTE